MTDEEYIRKAVELADGWNMHPNGKGFVREFDDSGFNFMSFYFDPEYKIELDFAKDALAAQLVRQVDGTLADDGEYRLNVWTDIDSTEILDNHHTGSFGGYKTISLQRGSNRTMNTIKAIVDSKVLGG